MELVAFARRTACVLTGTVAAMLDASPVLASHPLLTEDTGVLGKGVYELELHGERARASGARSTETVVKLGYGLAETLDVEVELPYTRTVADGSVTRGRGDTGLGAKWRFFEKEAFSMALKPELLLPTGRDALGLGAGRVGWAANLIGAYELAKIELLGHLGYKHNRNRIGARGELWHLSTALRWAATEKLKLVVDLGRDSNPDPAVRTALRDVVYGLSYALQEDVDLAIGLKKGLNDEADDRALRAGIRLRW